MARTRHSARHRARGAGMIETMVGILVGLIVILVIYSLLSAAENYRRTTTGASDAQITGLLSQFIMSRDISNGGNGTMLSAADLVKCTKDEAGAATLRNKPVPVLITDGGANEISDTFVAMNSTSSRVVWPVEFTANSAVGTNFEVQTPNGFTAPVPSVADPYWVVVAAGDGTGRCQLYQIKAATAPDALGRVTLTPTVPSTYAYAASASKVVILGPSSLATRVQYESWNTALNEPCGTTAENKRQCQLTSRDVMNPNQALWPARNPVAANVVLVKAQYGVDITAPNADGTVDCWTAAVIVASSKCPANALFPGGYTPALIQDSSLDQLNRVIAVRIAVVVRSDEPDLKDDTLLAANRPPLVLFNCAANTDVGCPGRITLTAGNGNQILQDYWRYRVYETIVPLRNSIFIGSM
jgi:type IV pilus assembly protein PilW